MDTTIKEVYKFSVKIQEQEIGLINNRLEFINWLFVVAIALLFFSFLALIIIIPDSCSESNRENYIALLIGIFAFLAISCTFLGKLEGFESIVNRIHILTLLNLQKTFFLQEQSINDNQYNKVIKFMAFEYLPKIEKEKYDSCVNYINRKRSEVLWLSLSNGCVFISLTSLLMLLVELTI